MHLENVARQPRSIAKGLDAPLEPGHVGVEVLQDLLVVGEPERLVVEAALDPHSPALPFPIANRSGRPVERPLDRPNDSLGHIEFAHAKVLVNRHNDEVEHGEDFRGIVE